MTEGANLSTYARPIVNLTSLIEGGGKIADFDGGSLGSPFREIPLLGEMSAKQTKGFPFPEEKLADAELLTERANLFHLPVSMIYKPW